MTHELDEQQEKLVLACVALRQAGVPDEAILKFRPRPTPEVSQEVQVEIARCQDLLEAIAHSRELSQKARTEALVGHMFGITDLPIEYAQYFKYAYLMVFRNGIFKIGKSKDPDARQFSLKAEYKNKPDQLYRYMTVLPVELEGALCAHFAHLGVLRPRRRELFKMPLMEVAQFVETAAELEELVLDERASQLKREIMQLELRLRYG